MCLLKMYLSPSRSKTKPVGTTGKSIAGIHQKTHLGKEPYAFKFFKQTRKKYLLNREERVTSLPAVQAPVTNITPK